MKQYHVYIMSNPWRTFYVGVTNNLAYRVYEHQHKLLPGFTARYDLTMLVYFESTDDIGAAIAREKQIKGWLRKKKVALIESVNPTWQDLSLAWTDGEGERALRSAQGDTEKGTGLPPVPSPAEVSRNRS